MSGSFFNIIFFLVISAFFSGVEIAFISSNLLHIELLSKQGNASAERLVKLFANPSRFIVIAMLGNTFGLVMYDVYLTDTLDALFFQNLNLSFQNQIAFIFLHSIVASLIALIFAEFLPKSIFLTHPNTLLMFLSIPLTIINKLMYPLAQLILLPTKWLMQKVLKIDFFEEKPVFGYTDLDYFIRQHTTTPQDDQKKLEIDTDILKNALDFKHLKVEDCMRPRTEIVAIDYNKGIDEVRNLFKASGHSKIVVYKNSIDEIVGYIHIMALLSNPQKIDEILTPILVVPEVSSASQLLLKFIEERKSLAIAVDEFGGTAGIVSMEDIIEEIFGEIEDEYDELETPLIRKIDVNKYIINARTEIDYLNKLLNLNLPHGDYETIGGYIIAELEDIPKENQKIELNSYIITIKKIDGNKINEIELTTLSNSE
jgi:CBS domain containing-hemolysin-like protein